MKKKAGIIFLCCLCLALLFGGCSGQKKEQTDSSEEGTAVYYSNESCTRLVSVSRGLEFPGITTPMIPSAVAMYMLGMLVTFSGRINFFALIFIFQWSVIALSKIVLFDIPEDLLLAVSCLPAMFVFFRDAVRSGEEAKKPSQRTITILIFFIMALIGACVTIQYV